MVEMKLNSRQMAAFRAFISEAQTAQNALNAAQGKIAAFFETIKAQFDLPKEVASLQVDNENGAITFTLPAPIVQGISDGGEPGTVKPLALVPEVDAVDQVN